MTLSGRTRERLCAHFEVECRLAARLREANAEERRGLYAQVYEELFRLIPDHPQLARKVKTEERTRVVRSELRLLTPLLTPMSTFLEIGAGDAALSRAVAPHAEHVIALEVAEGMAEPPGSLPGNVTMKLVQGVDVPVAESSVQLAYSHQLIEHLHPDDVATHLENVYKALVPGGYYLCLTSSLLTGPHDISRYFGRVACGLHLQEYDYRSLALVFRKAGYRRLKAVIWAKGLRICVPLSFAVMLESLLRYLPRWVRRIRPLQHLLEVRLLAER